jgi:sugar lactone lactonase YvrE
MLDFPWVGSPIWSADGSALYFTVLDKGTSVIMRRRVADGAQTETARFPGLVWPAVINRDETELIVCHETSGDLMKLRTREPGKLEPFIADRQAREQLAVGSPDGKWVAYSSDETGTFEVYAARLDDPSVKIQISHGGGTQPVWRPDNRELYFVDSHGMLEALAVEVRGDDLVPGEAQPLFHVSTSLGMSAARVCAPMADGTRFLAIRPVVAEAPVLRLVTNWKKSMDDE